MISRYFNVERERKTPVRFKRCKYYNKTLTDHFIDINYDNMIVMCNKLDQLTTKKNCELCLNFKELNEKHA